MSDTPFGFGLPPEEPEDGDEGKKKDPTGGGQGSGGPANPFGIGPGAGGDNPFAAMFGSMNPNDLGAAFQQLGQMLSYEGGPVNWDMAKQIARQTVSQGTTDGSKDASVGPTERASVDEALRLADLWLDGVTSLPSGSVSTVAWSRAEWVEATMPTWRTVVEPVAAGVGRAVADAMRAQIEELGD
ncbi:MAG: zinc-dependent metalloprotease, partial [Actinomycetes bacterium]